MGLKNTLKYDLPCQAYEIQLFNKNVQGQKTCVTRVQSIKITNYNANNINTVPIIPLHFDNLLFLLHYYTH